MVDLLSAARAEMLAAAEYYELHEPELGGRFLDRVESALHRNEAMPEAWPPYLPDAAAGEARHIPLEPFRESVVYILDPNPLVVAFAHSSRRPGYWWGRLRDR